MLSLTMLPARQGDALWIRWGNPDCLHQLIIDMGTAESGNDLHNRLKALDETQRNFELLVVTHVDADHIGGVLTCLVDAEPLPGLVFKDVWFNGWVHLNGGEVGKSGQSSTLESFGPAQGERLSNWLSQQQWNKAFSGKQVSRIPDTAPTTVTLAGGLTLTVLGPTPERLRQFIPKWKEEVEIALEKGTLHKVSSRLESYGAKTPPVLETLEDLKALAEMNTGRDASEANGSSISLLLEYKKRRIVLAGDSFADDLVESLAEVSKGQKLDIDAFKLPHHGSKNNVTKALVESVSCPYWLFSTDGTQFSHPEAAGVARVICYSAQKPIDLSFNVPSTFNGWWANTEWKELYQYNSRYGDDTEGLTIKFPTGSEQQISVTHI